VQYMARICCEAQSANRNAVMFNSIKHMQTIPMIPEEAICSSAVNTTFEIEAKALVVLSNTGRSARLLSKYRPDCPIFCASQTREICRSLTLVRSVVPVFYDTEKLGEDEDREKRVWLCIEHAKEVGLLAVGDLVVAVHADARTKGFANQSRVVVVK
jgi:pyruvate kinase